MVSPKFNIGDIITTGYPNYTKYQILEAHTRQQLGNNVDKEFFYKCHQLDAFKAIHFFEEDRLQLAK